MKRIFNDEELDYIKLNYKWKTYKEITEEINKFNIIKKTEKQVRTKASSCLKLSKAKYYFLEYLNNKIFSICNFKGSLYKEYDMKYNLVFTSKYTSKAILDLIYKDSTIYLDRKFILYNKISRL